MSTLTIEIETPTIQKVEVTNKNLTVTLNDQRRLSVPIAWYPRLLHGRPDERKNWRLIGQEGEGIHWPDLDEDISVANLLAGQKSGESARSLEKWLSQRSL